APGADEPAFQLTLARSGRTITVGSSQSIVDALASHGVRVSVSCEQGLCGTCETRVLSGEIDHHDFHYSKAERDAQDRMLICC
ncbi:2Fe-2S iron-sulfur cluster binding domain-containing protein, partial [Escherichia coli]|uniref:2Fe-2S iron-sulfur cluster-binding protein n=1 Tax=Escherichia coli TaxID=562 RepID=UPI0015E60603